MLFGRGEIGNITFDPDAFRSSVDPFYEMVFWYLVVTGGDIRRRGLTNTTGYPGKQMGDGDDHAPVSGIFLLVMYSVSSYNRIRKDTLQIFTFHGIMVDYSRLWLTVAISHSNFCFDALLPRSLHSNASD